MRRRVPEQRTRLREPARQLVVPRLDRLGGDPAAVLGRDSPQRLLGIRVTAEFHFKARFLCEKFSAGRIVRQRFFDVPERLRKAVQGQHDRSHLADGREIARLDRKRTPRHMLGANDVVDVAALAIALEILAGEFARAQHIVRQVLPYRAFPKSDELRTPLVIATGRHARRWRCRRGIDGTCRERRP